MIGLDTNILVRYFVQDEPAQAAAAERLIEGLTAERPGFVSMVVLVETVWVLSGAYTTSKDTLLAIIEGVLRSPVLVVEKATELHRALDRYRAGSCDFADAVIAQLASSAGCDRTLTFDRRAAATAGMTLLAAPA